MSTKLKLVSLSLVTLISYSLGRFQAPEKVRVETKIVEVEKKTKDTDISVDKNKHKKTTVTETTKPDGTKTVTTVITEDTDTKADRKSKTTDDKTTSSDTLKEVIRPSSKVVISAMAGVNLTLSGNPLVYGGSIQKQILGPISLGAFYLTPAVTGISVGLTF